MSQEGQTTLIITRHGLVENPKDILYFRAVDVPLTPEGHQQMEAVGRKLRDAGYVPSVIYTSPLLRTVQSSEEIAKAFPGVEIVRDESLLETYAPGLEVRNNRWIAEIEDQGYDVYSYPDTKSQVEPRDAVGERLFGAIKAITIKHAGETVLIVSHGDPIAILKHKMLHPELPLPPMPVIKKSGVYPEKGEAWVIELNSDGSIAGRNIIS